MSAAASPTSIVAHPSSTPAAKFCYRRHRHPGRRPGSRDTCIAQIVADRLEARSRHGSASARAIPKACLPPAAAPAARHRCRSPACRSTDAAEARPATNWRNQPRRRDGWKPPTADLIYDTGPTVFRWPAPTAGSACSSLPTPQEPLSHSAATIRRRSTPPFPNGCLCRRGRRLTPRPATCQLIVRFTGLDDIGTRLQSP